MNVLVTGGCGYIGSHTCLALQAAGMKPVVIDNLGNSKRSVLGRVAAISGQQPVFYQGIFVMPALLDRIFAEQQIDSVIHFAALKEVGESTRVPLDYYENNLGGTLTLLQEMKRAAVHNLVFSTSATVYGNLTSLPIREDFPRSAINPYGRSKLIIEEILEGLQLAEPDWSMTLLLYFNPVGAHESGTMGGRPARHPQQSDALYHPGGHRPSRLPLSLWKRLPHPGRHRCARLHLCNGSRRRARQGSATLRWQATRDIDAMCADSWRWQSANPNDYEE